MPASASGPDLLVDTADFPHSRFLGADAATGLLAELHTAGIAGAVYDALVGAAAREHGMALATRDRWALDTYRALDVRLEVLS
jgi:predicted nucleic acid-binding protein